MQPDAALVRGGVPKGTTARALSQPGHVYAVYVKGEGVSVLALELPAGRYRAEWVNPRTGAVDRKEDLQHAGGVVEVAAPAYTEDVALRVRAREGAGG
jgi:hypothetical protein